MHLYMHVYSLAYTRMPTCMSTHMCTCACARARTHTHAHACARAHECLQVPGSAIQCIASAIECVAHSAWRWTCSSLGPASARHSSAHMPQVNSIHGIHSNMHVHTRAVTHHSCSMHPLQALALRPRSPGEERQEREQEREVCLHMNCNCPHMSHACSCCVCMAPMCM